MTRPLPRPRSVGAIAAVVLSATLLSACAGSGAPQPAPTESAAGAPSSPVPTAAPDQTSVPEAVPTCDAIIPETTVAQLEDAGWTAKSEPLRLGEMVIDEGIQCIWGDYTIATDHVQIYGWAPIDADDARTAQQQLVQTGWTREEAPEGVYVTESKATAMFADADGYGLTYLFGDGWVKYADTKQSIILVEWPPN